MTTNHGWLIKWFMMWSLRIADPDSRIEIAMDQTSMRESETKVSAWGSFSLIVLLQLNRVTATVFFFCDDDPCWHIQVI